MTFKGMVVVQNEDGTRGDVLVVFEDLGALFPVLVKPRQMASGAA